MNYSKYNNINSLVNIIRVYRKDILEIIIEIIENTIIAIIIKLK